MNDNEVANGNVDTTSTSFAGICPNQKTTSSVEDLSEYTDADEPISAPTEILAEFLSSIMRKDYQSAFKYCKLILHYEPNHNTAKEFFPLLSEKCSQSITNEEEDDDTLSESDSEPDYNSDDIDDNDDDNDGSVDNDVDSDDDSMEDGDESSSVSSPEEDAKCDIDHSSIDRSNEIGATTTTTSYSSLDDEVQDDPTSGSSSH